MSVAVGKNREADRNEDGDRKCVHEEPNLYGAENGLQAGWLCDADSGAMDARIFDPIGLRSSSDANRSMDPRECAIGVDKDFAGWFS